MCGCQAHHTLGALCTCWCPETEHHAQLLLLAGGAGHVFRLDPAVHPCQGHKEHRPQPLVTVRHHLQPLGMGGEDGPENWFDICDTGHRNTHTILGPMCQEGPEYGKVGKRGTRTERDAAKRGFSAWVAAGKPGNPHAAYG